MTFPINQPSPDEPEVVHVAWRAARTAWQMERQAVTLLADCDGRVSAETKKYLEEGVAHAENKCNDAVANRIATLRATRPSHAPSQRASGAA